MSALTVISPVEPARKSRKRATKTSSTESPKVPTKQPSARAIARANRHAWSHTGLYTCVLLSAGLNGYAHGTHSSMWSTEWFASVGIGCVIPFIVLVLCKVAGMQYKDRTCMRTITIRGRQFTFMLAYFTALVSASLLALSVYHCAESISALTHSAWWMGVCMAITIDGGLVACELDIVLA